LEAEIDKLTRQQHKLRAAIDDWHSVRKIDAESREQLLSRSERGASQIEQLQAQLLGMVVADWSKSSVEQMDRTAQEADDIHRQAHNLQGWESRTKNLQHLQEEQSRAQAAKESKSREAIESEMAVLAKRLHDDELNVKQAKDELAKRKKDEASEAAEIQKELDLLMARQNMLDDSDTDAASTKEEEEARDELGLMNQAEATNSQADTVSKRSGTEELKELSMMQSHKAADAGIRKRSTSLAATQAALTQTEAQTNEDAALTHEEDIDMVDRLLRLENIQAAHDKKDLMKLRDRLEPLKTQLSSRDGE